MAKRLLLGMAIMGGLLVTVSIPAVADPSCYTGCAPGPSGVVGTSAPQTKSQSSGPPALAPDQGGPVTRSAGSLPFTGADIAELTVLGLVLAGAGAGLVLSRRRRLSSSAPTADR